MRALDMLSQKNGLKTTQSVLGKQQSGVDAQQKANPQEASTFTQKQLDAAGKKVDQANAYTPETPTMKEAQTRTIANQQGVMNGIQTNGGVDAEEQDKPSIPIVKKDEKSQQEQPKQMSYADMFKAIYGNGEDETPEQKARREKREKTKARIAAIGDGLRALSNMYFATKGAKVVHDPKSDMTPTMMKRKQMLEQQREKNKAAWLNGYLKAQALDEEARKNNLTLAEQMRYHDILAGKFDRAGDQADKKIEQSGQRLQQNADRIAETKRHNQESEQNSRDANNIRATKGSGKGGSRKGGKGKTAKEDYSKTLVDLNSKDPNGVKQVTRGLKRSGVPRSAKTIVESYRKQNGSHNGGNSGKKKTTGVKW